MVVSPEPNESKQEPFNFRRELRVFLGEAEKWDDYYKIDLRYRRSPDELPNSQACWTVGYESAYNNPRKPIEGSVESLVIPQISEKRAKITAPPLMAFLANEDMPEELSAVIRSDDQSKPPDFNNLKCVEIVIGFKNTFADGIKRESSEIYRVDLTKEPPVLYQRVPIPENEQPKRSGVDGEDEFFTALVDFMDPLPKFRYVEINDGELERVTRIVGDCRRAQLQNYAYPASQNP